KIWVNRLLTKRRKLLKRLTKSAITLSFLLNACAYTCSNLGNDGLKFLNRLLPAVKCRWLISKKGFEDFYKTTRFRDILIEDSVGISVEDGTIWRLEQDIVSWIAFRKFLPDLLRKIVLGVFCFPVPMGDFEIIEQRPVWVDRPIAALKRGFFGKRPSVL